MTPIIENKKIRKIIFTLKSQNIKEFKYLLFSFFYFTGAFLVKTLLYGLLWVLLWGSIEEIFPLKRKCQGQAQKQCLHFFNSSKYLRDKMQLYSNNACELLKILLC
jgi:hypothetical protein